MKPADREFLIECLHDYAEALPPEAGFVIAGCTIGKGGDKATTKFAHANVSAPELAVIALRILEETRDALFTQAANSTARELMLVVDAACAALSLIEETEETRQ